MRIAAMKVLFSGIYDWGTGWVSSEKEEAWKDWFENLGSTVDPSFWSYFDSDGFVRGKYLVCSSGSVYLHPREMSCVTHANVVTKEKVDGRWMETFPELEELKEILAGAANACGGIVEFSDIAVGDIEDPVFSRKGKQR